MSKISADVNIATLLDLKSELAKKKQTVADGKANAAPSQLASLGGYVRGQNAVQKPFLFTRADKESKTTQSLQRQEKLRKLEAEMWEEQEALQRSRQALLEKSKIYDDLAQGKTTTVISDEHKEMFLVDFEHKKDAPSASTDHCTNPPVHSPSDGSTSQPDHPPVAASHDGTSQDHESTSNENDSSVPSDAVHYQHVRHNEVREHGAGYYEFSQDETERQSQIHGLKQLHEKTLAQRSASEKLLAKRKQMMEDRLAKVRERKRLKGLVEPASQIAENQPISELDSIPLPKDGPAQEKDADGLTREQKRERHVRPWDWGKKPEENNILNQDEWIAKRRRDRTQEFAPPSFYADS